MHPNSEFDLNLIRTFLEVYRAGSFTKAGESLGITQPSISAAIRKMEADIGYQLFIKQGRGIAPTANAHKLATRCQNSFSEIINAISDQSSFSVHVTESLLHHVTGFRHIHVRESSADQYEIVQQLRHQKLDLALSVFTVKDPSLVIEPIFEEPAVVICRKDHPTIGGAITEQQFYQHEHVILAAQWERLSGFEYGALVPTQERTSHITVGSKSAKLMLVSSSDAIAVVSQRFAEQWQTTLGLKLLASPIELKPFTYSFAYHKRYTNLASHQQLREEIKQNIINQH